MAEDQCAVALSYLAWRGGDRRAGDALYSLSFRRLRAIALNLLRSEREGHTLQPTALVHECFLKLWSGSAVEIQDEEHFFGVAARAMKQALVDYGRYKTAVKRVAREQSQVFPSSHAPADPTRRLDARIALQRLEQLDAEVARTMRLRSMEGMTIDETAAAQGLKPARVRENHDFALHWLANKLGGKR